MLYAGNKTLQLQIYKPMYMSATIVSKFKSRCDSQDTYSCDQLALYDVASLVGKFDNNFVNLVGCLMLCNSLLL